MSEPTQPQQPKSNTISPEKTTAFYQAVDTFCTTQDVSASQVMGLALDLICKAHFSDPRAEPDTDTRLLRFITSRVMQYRAAIESEKRAESKKAKLIVPSQKIILPGDA